MTVRSKAQIAGAAPAKTKASQVPQQAEERYRNIFENAVEGIIQSTPGGRFLSLNPAMARIYGYASPEEMIESVTDIARQLYTDPKARLEFTRRIKIDGKVEKFEARNLRKDGSLIWTSTNARTVRDARGRVMYYDGFVQDITERRQAEEALRLSMQEISHAHDLLLALSQAAQAVQRASSPQEVYQAIQELTSRLGYHTTCFEFVDDSPQMKITYTDYKPSLIRKAEKLSGLTMEAFRFQPRSDSIFQRVISSGETIYVADAAHAVGDVFPAKLRRLSRQIAMLFKLAQSIFAPFVVDDKTFGMLAIAGPGLSEMDVPAITAFASQAAIAIHNARLYEQAQQEIAERRQAEEALRESEERYRGLVEQAPDMIGVLVGQRLVYLNQSGARLFGVERPEQMLGKTTADYMHPDDLPVIRERARRAAETGEPNPLIEFRIKRLDGALTEMEGVSIPFTYQGGRATQFIARDITERKQAEEALLESEEKYRTLFETMTQGVVYQAADGKIISANPAAERILGLTLGQMQGRTSTDPRWKAIHEDGSDFPGDTHPSMVALTTGKDVHDVVMGVFNPELEDYTWININAIPLFRQGETVPHQVYTTFEDITERKQAEEALRESEAKLKAVFEMLPVGISILDAERKISYLNSTLERILDISRESLFKGDHEGRTYLRPDGTPMPIEEYASVRTLKEQRAVHNVETGVVKEDGSVIWVSVSAVPVTFPDWKVVIVTSDITERKQAEEQIQNLARFPSENPNPVLRINQDGRIVYANEASLPLLHQYETAVGGTCPDRWRSSLDQAMAGKKVEVDIEMGEQIISFFVAGVPQAGYANLYGRDITEFRQAEEKIIRQITNLQTLYEGAHRLAEGLDLSYLAASVTRTCVDVFGIRLAWIGFAEPDGSVSVMNHYPAHIQYPRTTEERWDDVPRGHGPTGRAIRSAASQVVTDINQAPEYIPWRIAALREGFCTSAAFPLISRDLAFGVLNLYSDQPGFFTPERVEFFQAYANQAAAALEKGRLFTDLQLAHTRLRELSTRLVEIEEEQRHEIARELHDSVGQSLTALNINLSILQNQLNNQASKDIDTRLADSIKLVEQAVERIRDVMAELRPPVLDDYGLLPALRWYAEQYTGRTKIRSVVLEPQIAIPRLPPSVETALFRICQETLTNISRHAEASQVSLSLDMVDGSPRLTIQDDGIGFDPSQADTGWGLRIMCERAEAVGGRLVVESSPGKGTKVVVDVPLPPTGGSELPKTQE